MAAVGLVNVVLELQGREWGGVVMVPAAEDCGGGNGMGSNRIVNVSSAQESCVSSWMASSSRS